MVLKSASPKIGLQSKDGGVCISPKLGSKDTLLFSNPKMDFKANNGNPISVWWDYENCEIMRSADVGLIANNMVAELNKLGISGPLTFSAYGDVKRVPHQILEALHRTGITMVNVPSGKNATDLRMILDMSLWSAGNPSPATCILISGDKDFYTCLNWLRKRGYHILIAVPKAHSSLLVSVADHIWSWTDICMGKVSEPIATETKDDRLQRILTFGSQEPFLEWIKREEDKE